MSFAATGAVRPAADQLNSYVGDLGLDDGSPQNVFVLDIAELTPLNARNLDAGGITLSPGASYTRPDGKGTISFDGVKRYIAVDIRHNPGQLYALIFALLAVAGLVTSLYVNRAASGSAPAPTRRPHHRVRAPGPRRGPPAAGEAAALRTLLAAPGIGDGGSQSAPSGGADNDRADTTLGAGAGAGQVSPDHSAADFIQSTAGSSESREGTVMLPINETMGQYSELFMLLAAGTYTVAFIAFAWDLAKSSKTLRAVDLLAAELSGPGRSRSGGCRRRVLLRGVDRADADVAGPVGRAERRRRPTPGLPRQRCRHRQDGRRCHALPAERRAPARIAVALTVLGAAIHAVGVVTRAIGAGRVPWGNMYEFLTTGAFVAVAVFLLVLIRARTCASSAPSWWAWPSSCSWLPPSAYWTPVGHLVPALQSYWLIIHVSIAVLSSALFTLTFAMCALQLVQTHRQKTIAAGGADKLGFMRLVPSALRLENLSYRINAIAFVGWTFTVMFGAIWAEKAWGRFWGWDTKEVWTFVIWVVYAGYLHARATRGWTGTRAAWLSIVGYLCVVFNFTIVNQFFNGLHSYSGL